ncbi:hypothetical protein Q5H93_12425 [Hymenobacter sp. ASUV-10]|uniref:Alpha-E domain-containing protein n=1 Tax=Hymenobacter aranciens TaxID=3063996 RepID=A0ABT9BB96_9BACT|nr:DUF6712 family protein [Hymenobacter sp. ASUV-10]MDO7875541.1 hypothetical protein [Hymenobacter sp. ASUV-10]
MLLKTLDELKKFVATDATVDLPPAIALALGTVETSEVEPLLGSTLHAWLQAQYDAPGFDAAGPSVAARLLRAVQAPLSRLGTAAGLAGHQATIDNTGVHILSTDTSKTAFPWQVNQLRDSLERQGYRDLDTLVQWLEDHAGDAPELQAWAISVAGQRHRQELFTSTADFQQYENISSSRRVFIALGQVRRRLEHFELGRVLGLDFLQELRDQVRDRGLTSDNRNLLRTYVYPALAALAIGHGIPELGLRLADDGIELTIARVDDSNAKEADAGLDQLLLGRASKALVSAERYLRHLTDYLDRTASATRFATYFHSPAYTAPNQPVVPTNTAESRIYKFC